MEHVIPPRLLEYILVKLLISTIGKTLKIPGYAYVIITLFQNHAKMDAMKKKIM